MRKKLVLLTLFLTAILVTLIIKSNKTPGADIQSSKVEQGRIKNSFYTSGTLAYRNQARLSAELVAKVTHIYVEEGQAVEPGQELIKLDDSTVRTEISQMEAQVARGEIEIRRSRRDVEQKLIEWTRQNELISKGMVSRQALDSAQAALDGAKFQLETSEKNALQNVAALLQKQKLLEKTIVRSPIRGVVIAIPIKVGETAVASAVSLAGSSLMTIADPNSMVVEAQIAEFDIARIKLGQLATMTTRAVPDESFKGKVIRIARSVSNDSKSTSDNKSVRTVAVQIELDGSHSQFVSGMSCDLALVEAVQENALLIPLVALRIDDSGSDGFDRAKKRDYYVWVLKNGRTIKNKIEIGFADEHRQEVRKGLKLGDEIISGPAAYLELLRDGEALPVVTK